MLRVKCPQCGQLLQLAPTGQAVKVRCPACGQVMIVPAAAPPAPPPATAPPAPQPRPVAAAPPIPPPPATEESEVAGGLGAVVEEYRPRRWWIALAAAVVVALASLIGTVLAFRKVPYTSYIGPDREPREGWVYAAGSGTQNLLVLLTFAAAVATVVFLVKTLRTLNLAVTLHENGFLYRRWGRRFDCRWAEVESVYHVRRRRAGLVPERHFCEVHREDGASLTLPPALPRPGELCRAIRQGANGALLPLARAALRRGEEVLFGPEVALGPDGLRCFQTHFAWQDIGEVSLTAGQLSVASHDRDGPHVRVYAGVVGNVETLLDLLDDRAAVAASLPRGRGPAKEPARRPRPPGALGSYSCPRCGGAVQRGATSNAAGVAGGVAGVLIAQAFGSFQCANCGPIPRRELSPAVRRRMARNSVVLGVSGVLLFGIVIALIVLVRR